ncbi:hypothetical protein PAMP_011343 [Pampus punctatissimus]
MACTHMQTCCTQGRLSAGPLPGMSVPSLISDDKPTTVSCSDASHQVWSCMRAAGDRAGGDRSLRAKWKKKLHLSFCERRYTHRIHFTCAVRCVKISAELCWVVLFYSYFSNRDVILLQLMDEVLSKPPSSDNNGTFQSKRLQFVVRMWRGGVS